jgi:gliding motility-associated-like protein
LNTLRKYKQSILLVCLLTAGVVNLTGQISSATADAVKPIKYLTYTGIDQLFVFYQSHESFYPGQLTATGPSAGDFDFIWTKYDDVSDGFNIPLKLDTSLLSSTIDNLDEGGYRVQISNGIDVDTTFFAWVMLDDFKVWAVKDALGQVPANQSGCPGDLNWIRVAGGVELDRAFYYFDLVTHDTLRIYNNYDMEWTSDNVDLLIPNRTNKNALAGNYSSAPPYEDTWYILTATDSMGMTEIDSVFYDTKFTKAEFTVEYYDKVALDWSADLTTEWNPPPSSSNTGKGSLDAPLTAKFLNTSVNGYSFIWVLLDTTNEESGLSTYEYEETDSKDYIPEFTYYTADKYYYPYLISISDANCIDTFFLDDGIEVKEAQLVIPNVFTPNGDEINPVWTFKHQSIKEFKVTIADRFGRVVYRQHIYDIYEWEGWRGTVLNTDREAPKGQYYYVIEALGYDNKEFKDPNYIQKLKNERQTGSGGLLGGGSTQSTPSAGEETQSLNLYTGWIYLFR